MGIKIASPNGCSESTALESLDDGEGSGGSETTDEEGRNGAVGVSASGEERSVNEGGENVGERRTRTIRSQLQ